MAQLKISYSAGSLYLHRLNAANFQDITQGRTVTWQS